jgi:hypothetical protein
MPINLAVYQSTEPWCLRWSEQLAPPCRMEDGIGDGKTGMALLARREVSLHPDDLRNREPFADEIQRQLTIVKVFGGVEPRLDNIPNQDSGMKGISGPTAVTDLAEDHDLASRGDLDFRTFRDRNGEFKAQA